MEYGDTSHILTSSTSSQPNIPKQSQKNLSTKCLLSHSGVFMDNNLLKRMGKRIRDSRKSQKITQEELSEMAEISSSFLGMIERGQRIPSLMTISKICNSLDISIDFLLELQSEKVKKKNVKYLAKDTKEKDAVTDRIIRLLKDKKPEDRELALKILKKLFCK